jgi:hypothetical protein
MPIPSNSSGDVQADFWHRPLPTKIAGFTFLIGTALLLLGGAYREQPGLFRSGLMFLALGAVLLPGAFRRTWGMKAAFFALAIIGVFYAVTT